MGGGGRLISKNECNFSKTSFACFLTPIFNWSLSFPLFLFTYRMFCTYFKPVLLFQPWPLSSNNGYIYWLYLSTFQHDTPPDSFIFLDWTKNFSDFKISASTLSSDTVNADTTDAKEFNFCMIKPTLISDKIFVILYTYFLRSLCYGIITQLIPDLSTLCCCHSLVPLIFIKRACTFFYNET